MEKQNNNINLSSLSDAEFRTFIMDYDDGQPLDIYEAGIPEEAATLAGEYLNRDRNTSYDMCAEFISQHLGVCAAHEPGEISEGEMMRLVGNECKQHHNNVAVCLEALRRNLNKYGDQYYQPERK